MFQSEDYEDLESMTKMEIAKEKYDKERFISSASRCSSILLTPSFV